MHLTETLVSPGQLDRRLRTVGKESFEEDYDIYEAYGTGRRSRDRCIDELVRRGCSNESGAGWRLGAAKAIFKAGKERAAPALARARR